MDVSIKKEISIDITKGNFEAYEKVRKSGVTNMFDVRRVEMLSGLSRDKIISIIKNYERLREAYSDVEQNIKRLKEIQEEINNLNDEAIKLLKNTTEYDRAHSYWYAHIQGALGDDYNQFLGGSMVSMQDTIESLENPEEEEDG